MPPYNGFEQGLKLYYDQWLAALPDEDDPAIAHEFSKRFERRMARLIVQQRKPYYPVINRAWKRALLAAIIALMLFLAAMSVGAVRERVIRFFIKIYNTFSTVVLKPESLNGPMLAQIFVITDLPDGYELIASEQLELSTRYVYRHPNGSSLSFQQFMPDFAQFIIDTEGISLEDVPLDGFAGQYYSRNGRGNLLWYSHGYAFLLSGDLDKEILVRAALSVTPEK